MRRGVDFEKARDDFVNDTVGGRELDLRAIDFNVLATFASLGVSPRSSRNGHEADVVALQDDVAGIGGNLSVVTSA